MTSEDVKTKLIEVLEQIQSDCEDRGQQITGTTCSIDDLGWFDSYLWPVAISMLASVLNSNIPNDKNIFLSEDGTRRLTIDESADVVCEIISREENHG
jgi:hypothetical protein